MKNSILKLTTLAFLFLFFSSCREDDILEDILQCEVISEDITTTLTLTDRNPSNPNAVDYCITGEIRVIEGAGLIIEPGVKIEFSQNAGITIGYLSNGYIIAEGTNTAPILFTGQVQTAGFWRGIYINHNSNDVRNSLDHCIIEYAGSEELASSPGGFGYKAAIGVGKNSSGPIGLVSIKNTTIRYTEGNGYASKASGLNQFSNNHFENNSEAAITLSIYGFSKIDGLSTFTGNGINGVYGNEGINGDEISDGTNHFWEKLSNGAAYYINENVRINGSTHININPGVTLIMNDNDAGLKIVYSNSSSITAVGTAAEPITIRGATPGTSSWAGINIIDNTDNRFEYCNISEAGFEEMGHTGCNSYLKTTFNIGGCGRASISNCTISYSDGCGIHVSASNLANLTEGDNTFIGNTGTAICN